MPGYISLADQGITGPNSPGNVMQDSVAQSIANELRAQQAQKQAAENAPIIDPSVVHNRVLAAQTGSGTDAASAAFLASQPYYIRAAIAKGLLPLSSVTGTSFDPKTGAQTTTENTNLPGADGTPTPFGGTKTTGAPPTGSQVTIGNENPNSPGLAPVTDQRTVIDPSTGKPVPVGPPTGTVQRTGRTTWQQGTQNMLMAARAVVSDPNASDTEKKLAQQTIDTATGMINNVSATGPKTPANGNDPKQGPTNEYERNTSRLNRLAQQLKETDDPDEQSDIKNQMDALGKRQTFLNSRNQKADPLAAARAALGLDQPDASGTSQGTAMPDTQKTNILKARNTQGSGQDGSAPNSTIPTAQNPARAGSVDGAAKFKVGMRYKDANGNRATWDGKKFVPVQDEGSNE